MTFSIDLVMAAAKQGANELTYLIYICTDPIGSLLFAAEIEPLQGVRRKNQRVNSNLQNELYQTLRNQQIVGIGDAKFHRFLPLLTRVWLTLPRDNAAMVVVMSVFALTDGIAKTDSTRVITFGPVRASAKSPFSAIEIL
jgi:hypothetical protein